MQLIQSLFGRISQGYVCLWTKQDKTTYWYDLAKHGTLEEMQRKAESMPDQDVYFSTCPAKNSAGGKQRINQGMVSMVPSLFMDIDTLQDETKAGKNLPATVEAGVAALDHLQHPPSITVCSGNGVHAYWLLEEPLAVDSGPALKRAKGILKGFAQLTAQEMGFLDLDLGASEPARVLRVPGTFNHKGGKRMLVQQMGGTGALYALEALYVEEIAARKPVDVKPPQADTSPELGPLTDAQVITRASRGKRGDVFSRLYSGQWESDFKSQSEADLAFCDTLAFWTQGNAAQMDSIVRQSGLMRPKWDERHGVTTYGESCINKALDTTANFYDPTREKPVQATDSPFQRYERAYEITNGYAAKHGTTCEEYIDKRNMELVSRPLASFAALITAEITLDDGAEVKKEFQIEGITSTGRGLPCVRVPSNRFAGMSWVLEGWGNRAIIMPGQTVKDKLRHAIQTASLPFAAEETVYTHTGWRRIGGKWCYLHQGGAVGQHGVSVELKGALAMYALPDQTGNVKEAAAASLAVLEVLPKRISVPLLAHMYLAPLVSPLETAGFPPAFALYFSGRSGSLKTTAAALGLAHFGAAFNSKRVPSSFNDTANSVQEKAFELKDMPLLVDDYAPSLNPVEQRKKASDAHKLIRAWGDNSERGRMHADGTLKTARPPRGLGFMTGEQLPDAGESGTARLFVVDIARGEIQITDALTDLQNTAHEGHLARAMRGYIEWLLPQMNELPDKLRAAFVDMRRWATSAGTHRRQPETIAWILVGYNAMLQYFAYAGLEIDGHAMLEEAKRVILDHSEAQAGTLRDENPAKMFFDALEEMSITGEVRASSMSDAWSGESVVAYLDSSYIYLLPGASYGKVSEFYRLQGTMFPIRKGELWRRLADQKLIATWGTDYSKTKRIPGLGSPRCVWLKREMADTLFDKAKAPEVLPSEPRQMRL